MRLSAIFSIILLIGACKKTSNGPGDQPPGEQPPPVTPQNILWQKTFGGSVAEQGNAIIATPDENYLMAGYTNSNNGDVSGNKGEADVWLIKFTGLGTIIWQKTFGGSGNDRAYSVINTSDGGFAIAGFTASRYDDVSGNHGNRDIWVVKLDSEGNITWQKCLGGSKDEIGYAVTEITGGDLIIAGRTNSNDGDATGSHGSSDVFIARLNTNGNVVWTKVIGGSGSDEGLAIATTPDNALVIAGSSEYTELLALKLDNDGNILWQKTFGGSGAEVGNSILATVDGGCVIAGLTWSNDGDVSGNHGNNDGWVLKIDAAGTLQWAKTIGGTSLDFFSSVTMDTQGRYIITGGSKSKDGDLFSSKGGEDLWTILLDADGKPLKTNSFGGTKDDVAKAIISTPYGYLAVGSTGSNDGHVSESHGDLDAWVVEFKF